MKLKIIPIVLLLAACTNNTEGHVAANPADHNHHGEDGTAMATTGSSAMAAMHRVMNESMQQMKAAQVTGDADYDFAALMKLHHQSAIDMAKIELASGTDLQMKALAQKIIADQQKEISQLDAFLQNHQPAGNSDYGKKAVAMMTEMGAMSMAGGSLDAMFASMMIPHHEDAVKMSEHYLAAGKNAELKALAQNIMTTQPKEVAEMKDWLSKQKEAQ